MRAKAANEPFNEDLEDGGGNKRVEKADGGVIYVPEAADADLADEEDDNRDEDGEEGGSHYGNDFVA